MDRLSIAVIGSLVYDCTFHLENLPRPGETIWATEATQDFGGKGCNQAVALARLGCNVTLAGAVGNDPFATRFRHFLQGEGINCRWLYTIDGESTGLGIPLIAGDKRKAIIVHLGANACVQTSHVADLIRNEQFDAVVIQCELPLETTRYVIEEARRRGISIFFNVAPIAPGYEALCPSADLIVVNRREAEWLSGIAITSVKEAETALMLIAPNSESIVAITLGPDGCILRDRSHSGPIRIGATNVDVRDPTAAGDAFVAGMAFGLLRGKSSEESAEFATKCASFSCRAFGSASSMPTHNQVG